MARGFYHNPTIYGSAKALEEKDVQFGINGSGRLPEAQKYQVPEACGGAANTEKLQ